MSRQTITDFLEARIAEDKEEAEHFLERYRQGEDISKRRWLRILREAEAKSVIVSKHEPVDYSGIGMESPNACQLCGVSTGMGDWEWVENSFPCDTLKAVAAVYADHPDYEKEWVL